MNKRELKKAMRRLEASIYEAQVDAESIQSELEENQGSVSDWQMDSIADFINGCEDARAEARRVYDE